MSFTVLHVPMSPQQSQMPVDHAFIPGLVATPDIFTWRATEPTQVSNSNTRKAIPTMKAWLARWAALDNATTSGTFFCIALKLGEQRLTECFHRKETRSLWEQTDSTLRTVLFSPCQSFYFHHSLSPFSLFLPSPLSSPSSSRSLSPHLPALQQKHVPKRMSDLRVGHSLRTQDNCKKPTEETLNSVPQLS